jgi:Tfp pilus assembly protein PilX
MTLADSSNKFQQFYNPTVQPLTAAGFLADNRVLSALIIMPLMTVVFIRFVIFLDGAGLNTLKSKLAMWRRQQALKQSHEYTMAMNTAYPNVDNQADIQAVADDDVLAEAAKISAGNVDENVPILLQNLVKTFVDASSGAEIKAVQGVSFEVPVSQVCKAARPNVPPHVVAMFWTMSDVHAVLRLHRTERRRQEHHHVFALRRHAALIRWFPNELFY